MMNYPFVKNKTLFGKTVFAGDADASILKETP